ncbi:hypothetical protein [Lewinella sp. IMCC34191]|uniref:hypothetical protein n=1 Tax=Lewinella sp. IMCC34191 TaxID=2259172 RepID=UPI000E23BF53|nr:hypothetical protein [Lewinella sp. IMCC34191]
MTRQATLATVTDVLLDDATPPTLLHDILETYRDLLLTVSGLDLGDEESLLPHDTGHGIAIGATWAALCLDDEVRTQRFVAGLHAAVSELMARGRSEPIHVLYAGTGPFATLALPVMSRFTPEQVRFTMLEINPVSLAALKRVIDGLGFGAYVSETIAADASTYQLSDRSVDILLSETMQYSLVDEMQVPICLNLLPQLPAGALLIPERIELRLGRMEDAEFSFLAEDLGHLLTIDRQRLMAYARTEQSTDFPTVRLPIPQAGGLLAIRTAITVYGNHRLLDYESGLTNPDIIGRFPDAQGVPEYIDFTYQVEPYPLLRLAFPVEAATLNSPQ